MTSSFQAVTHDEIQQALGRFLAKGGEIQVLPPNPEQELLLKRELRETEVLEYGIPELGLIPEPALGEPGAFEGSA